MKNSTKKFINKVLDIIFPKFCVICKRQGYLVCPDCLSLIEIMEYRYCPFCQRRVMSKEGKCKLHRYLKLDGLYFAASYNNIVVKTLIKKFKYQPFIKELSKPLSQLIIAHLHSIDNKIFLEDKENSLLLPVPIHKSKKRWRGFNQAEEIAKNLSICLGLPLKANNLQKIKKTKPQAYLKKSERIKNINGVFKIKNPPQIQGKRIFLVDDVFTTGSTMEECARVLKAAGAKKVWGIAIARELLN